MRKKIKKIIIKFFCFLFRWAKEKPTVLMYHSVADGNNPLSVNSKEFEKQIKYLKEKNFKFLSTKDLDDFDKFPNKSVLITFDDGYEDNFIIAVPILKKYKVPAVFFIATGLVGSANRELKMMNWEEIKTIDSDDLFEIGAHTVTHRKLHKLGWEEAREEIMTSKNILEEKLNKPIKIFAYPYGRYNQSVLDVIEKNDFKFAFSIKPGRIDGENDRYEIKRFGVDNYTSQFFKDIFKAGYNLYWQLRWVFYK